MRTLKVTKGEESYSLTFNDTDPNLERDRKDLTLAGWSVEEITPEPEPNTEADYTVYVSVTVVSMRTGKSVQHTASTLATLDVPLWYAIGDAAADARDVVTGAVRKGASHNHDRHDCRNHDRCETHGVGGTS